MGLRIHILYKDQFLIAVHKPSGLAVYAEDARKSTKPLGCKEVLEKQLRRSVYPVHRLDKDTCGILLFAFSPKSAGEMTRAFQKKNVKKTYIAVAHGLPQVAQGKIEKPLPKNKEKTLLPACTHYHTLDQIDFEAKGEMRTYSFLELEPETGRFHQIRKHLRAIGCPIIGDKIYGNSWDNKLFEELFSARRTLLSSVRIEMPHPVTNKLLILKTKPDKDFMNVIYNLGWKITSLSQ